MKDNTMYQNCRTDKSLGSSQIIQNNFQREEYLNLEKIQLRKIICKFRISSHNLRVVTERHKNKPGQGQGISAHKMILKMTFIS